MRTLLLLLLITPLAAPCSVAQELAPADSARHVLERLGFGPRPGEVAAVATGGVMRWVDSVLSEDRPVDRPLKEREAAFRLDRLAADPMMRQLIAAREERRDRQAGRPDSTREAPGPEAMAARHLLGRYQELAVVRAATARDQLREVMVDFWTNHFNVFLGKGLDRVLLPDYIEHTIRPNALGRFSDLLLATARSPAMLFYLDNVRSVRAGAEPPAVERLQRRAPGRLRDPDIARRLAQLPTGLNENYARELMELHTLGVDGGYTQKDVTEVARVLTGWGMTPPQQGVGFAFHAWAHDEGAKTVLGVRFPAGHGEDEGIRLIRMLADAPATMHHVSRKLCARFVADEPPDGCVDDAVRAWAASGGDILTVLRAIVHSPDFWARTAVDNKVKSPLEFVVSAVRAVDASPDTTPALAFMVARLGQPLFQEASPAGYPERQEEWVNSGALLQRMNFAMALASGRVPGLTMSLDRIAPTTSDANLLLDLVNHRILNGAMSSTTRNAIAAELADVRDPATARTLAVGLALGSPEFQRQ
jgi:uncharacterized protein (DUF1800 family)